MNESGNPRVTIVGGGISGLTAALRLAQRGYRVTVYESQESLGGNLGFYHHDEYPDPQARYYDVYTHMYGGFYRNFWKLVEEDLGLKRGMGKDFEPRSEVKYLKLGEFPKFVGMADMGSPSAVWQNLMCGLESPADMYLYLYSMIDALSFQLPDEFWDSVSVNGFAQSQAWNTYAVSELYDSTLMTIWSIHSYQVSMAAYRRFIAYRLPYPAPLLWLLTGNLYTKLVKPLVAKLESCGGTIRPLVEVAQVRVGDGRVVELKLQKTKYDPVGRHYVPDGPEEPMTIDEGEAVILALPPMPLYNLVVRGDTLDQTIYYRLPQLSKVRELGAATIPTFYVAFNKKLPNIPKENALLCDSSYDLTFLDLSQIWHDDPIIRIGGRPEGALRTVLAMAASNDFTLPSGWDHRQVGVLMIRQFHQYISEFQPPEYWGDPNSDIDWEFSYFNPALQQLFTNVVGGMQWQTQTNYPEQISNLYFAGNCARNDIEMATVESAVVSGLQAARAVWEQHKLGEPVTILKPETFSPTALLALNTLMTPAATAAKCWACASGALSNAAKGEWRKAGIAAVLGFTAPAAMAGTWLTRVGSWLMPR